MRSIRFTKGMGIEIFCKKCKIWNKATRMDCPKCKDLLWITRGKTK